MGEGVETGMTVKGLKALLRYYPDAAHVVIVQLEHMAPKGKYEVRKMTLSDLKAGDEVVVKASGYYQVYERHTITRVTPTQIVIGPNRYRKSDGYRIGDGTGWGTIRAYVITDEIRAEIRYRELVNHMKGQNWNSYPVQILEEIFEILKKAMK